MSIILKILNTWKQNWYDQAICHIQRNKTKKITLQWTKLQVIAKSFLHTKIFLIIAPNAPSDSKHVHITDLNLGTFQELYYFFMALLYCYVNRCFPILENVKHTYIYSMYGTVSSKITLLNIKTVCTVKWNGVHLSLTSSCWVTSAPASIRVITTSRCPE